MGDQLGAQARDRLGAHVDHDRLVRPDQRRPVELDLAILGMAGDEHQGLGVIAMGQRHAGMGRATERCGDPRHDVEGDAGLGQRLELLAAPTEDERVAALEPDHALAGPRQRDQQLIDPGLGQHVAIAHLADENGLRLRRHQLEHVRPHQPVVDHDVGRCSSRSARRVKRSAAPGPAPTRWTRPGAAGGVSGWSVMAAPLLQKEATLRGGPAAVNAQTPWQPGSKGTRSRRSAGSRPARRR